MSHSPETIQTFINLRSMGKTLLAISSQLDLPSSTVGDWNKRYAARIQHERAAKWEFCEHSATLGVESDLIRLSKRILACEKELERRPLASMPTAELLRLLSASRREYFRRRNPLLRPLDCVTPDAKTGHTLCNASSDASPCPAYPAGGMHSQDTPAPSSRLGISAVPSTSAKPEKTGNISGFHGKPIVPQPLATNGNHISGFRNGHAADDVTTISRKTVIKTTP